MFFIPGELISALTFPGVILHEWAHKLFCKRLGVKVLEVKYFQIGKKVAGYVVHEPPYYLQTDILDFRWTTFSKFTRSNFT